MKKQRAMERSDFLLPRGYISPSQVSLWESNPADYAVRYFLEGPGMYPVDALRFGKRFAQYLETRDRSLDYSGMMRMMAEKIPVLGEFENEVVKSLENEGRAVEVKCVFDLSTVFLDRVIEVKTGPLPWTQEAVNDSIQVGVYEALIFNSGVVPEIELQWFPTEQVDVTDLTPEGYEFTGAQEVFPYTPSPEHREGVIQRVFAAAEGIDKAYRSFLEAPEEYREVYHYLRAKNEYDQLREAVKESKLFMEKTREDLMAMIRRQGNAIFDRATQNTFGITPKGNLSQRSS